MDHMLRRSANVASGACLLVAVLFLCSFPTVRSARSEFTNFEEGCGVNVTEAAIYDFGARLAVGATTLRVFLVNINFSLPHSSVEFDHPLGNLNLTSFGCSCGGVTNDDKLFQCHLAFEFDAIAESLLGVDLHALIKQTAENGSVIVVANTTRVASIVSPPEIASNDTADLQQYSDSIKIQGTNLGVPGWNSTNDPLGLNTPLVSFVDASNASIAGKALAVPNADTLVVEFLQEGPSALGPLQARIKLWGVVTELTTVATVVEIHPDASSLLECPGSLVEGETQLCRVHFRGKKHNTVATSLDGFSAKIGADSAGTVGKPVLSSDKTQMLFNVTAPSVLGQMNVTATYNGTQLDNSPFILTINASPAAWKIAVTVVPSVGSVILIVILITLDYFWQKRAARKAAYLEVN